MSPAPPAEGSASPAPIADGEGLGPEGRGPSKAKPKKPPLWLGALLGAGVLLGLFGDLLGTQYVVSSNAQAAGRLVQASAQIPGLLREVLPQEGAQVEAGQVVARLERAEFEAAVQRAQAILAGAKANASAAQSGVALQGAQSRMNLATARSQWQQALQARAAAMANVAKAQNDHARLAGLAQQGIVSAMELEAARTLIVTAKSQAESAAAQVAGAQEALRHAGASRQEEAVRRDGVDLNQATVAQAEADLALARLRLAQCDIKAPTRGVVVRRLLAPGEAVALGQGVVALMDAQQLWVNVVLTETDAVRVQAGALAMVRFDAFPKQRFAGKVGFVAPTTAEAANPLAPSPSPGAMRLGPNVQAQIRLDAPSAALRPGLHATVRVEAKAP